MKVHSQLWHEVTYNKQLESYDIKLSMQPGRILLFYNWKLFFMYRLHLIYIYIHTQIGANSFKLFSASLALGSRTHRARVSS